MRYWLVIVVMASACGFPKPAEVASGELDASNGANAKIDAAGASSVDAAGSGSVPSPGFDHQRLLFPTLVNEGSAIVWQLSSVHLDGTNLKQLTNEQITTAAQETDYFGASSGTVSADGKYLVFNARNATSSSLVVENIDGTGRRILVSNITDRGPSAISPDGQRVAYVSGSDIYVTSFARGDADPAVRITPGDGLFYSNPSWGGNSKVAFDNSGSESSKSEVMSVNADGTDLVNLTNNPAYDAIPAFSPDGSKIAYIHGQSDHEVWIMNAEGSMPRQVTSTGADYNAAFDLTGKYVVYVGDDFVTYVIATDGTGKAPVPNAGGGNVVYPG